MTDPFVTGGTVRRIRDGSWNRASDYCRSAHRYSADPANTYDYVGFRVVLAPVLVP